MAVEAAGGVRRVSQPIVGHCVRCSTGRSYLQSASLQCDAAHGPNRRRNVRKTETLGFFSTVDSRGVDSVTLPSPVPQRHTSFIRIKSFVLDNLGMRRCRRNVLWRGVETRVVDFSIGVEMLRNCLASHRIRCGARFSVK